MGRHKNDGRGRLGGREKGVPNREENKLTKSAFRRITEQSLVPDPSHPQGLSKFEQYLELLEPNEWINAMLKITEFHTGRMKSVDMNIESADATLEIDAKLRLLAGEEDLDN